jgi:urease accessory protein
MTIQPNLNSFPGWQGHLRLTYRHHRAKTQVVQNQGTAPLKVQRSFYPEAESICHNTILHTAGGIVGGDKLQIDIDIEPQARVVITTAAASKIYGSNGTPAIQSIVHNIGENACLEWLPQETIVFNQAIFHQHLRVNLAATGSWLGWEINRFGRTARGERFTQGEWKSGTEVYRQGKPIWIDRQVLSGDTMVDSPHSLAGHSIVGSFAWIGEEVSKDLVIEARSLFDGESSKIGVTRLTSGLLCRYRGDSTTEVRQWFTAVWQLLRYSFLHSPPVQMRVWQ